MISGRRVVRDGEVRHARHAALTGGHESAIDRVQLVLDHPQRQVVVALLAKDIAQPGDVIRRELAIAGRRALRTDQPLGLQEPDLADRDIREVCTELAQHLTDGQRRPRPGRRSRGAGRAHEVIIPVRPQYRCARRR